MKKINILNFILMFLGFSIWIVTDNLAGLFGSLFAYLSMLAGEFNEIKKLLKGGNNERRR